MVKASARPSVTSLAEKPLAVSLFAQAQDWPLCVICDRPSSPWDRNFCAGHFPHPVLRGDDIPLHEERTPSFVYPETPLVDTRASGEPPVLVFTRNELAGVSSMEATWILPDW